MLLAEVRLGSHRAQGQGRHQGAAAALISPKASHHLLHLGKKRKAGVPRERKKEQEAGELEEEKKQKEGEEQEDGDSTSAATDRGASASLLPPRRELPAPTVTRQLRAAFYSCTHTHTHW